MAGVKNKSKEEWRTKKGVRETKVEGVRRQENGG